MDPTFFRSVMGSFCTGVSVVTSVDDGEPVGFTCQSLTSVSLDPPLVSFCSALTSTTWPRVRRNGRVLINVLADAHAETSATFARSGADKFAAVDWHWTPSGLPALDGALTQIEATVVTEHIAGDHTLILAEVQSAWTDESRDPLLFFRSAYQVLAPAEQLSCR